MDEFMLSSVSLRFSRSKATRLKKPVKVKCTMCGEDKLLGKTTDSMLRMQCGEGQWVLCGSCIDVVADMVRYGARLVDDAARWEVSTLVLRVSHRIEYMLCGRCGQHSDDHVLLVFDDLRHMPLKKGRCDGSVRMCSKCFVEAVALLESSGVAKEFRFPMCEGPLMSTYGW